MFDNPPIPEKGEMTVPTEAGLGLKFAPNLFEKYGSVRRPVALTRARIKSLAGQLLFSVPAELKASRKKERVTPFFESTQAPLSPGVWQAGGQT
jgi:hypothetical protein